MKNINRQSANSIETSINTMHHKTNVAKRLPYAHRVFSTWGYFTETVCGIYMTKEVGKTEESLAILVQTPLLPIITLLVLLGNVPV